MSEAKTPSEISRRTFLKRSLTLAAGLGSSGLLAACAPSTPAPTTAPAAPTAASIAQPAVTVVAPAATTSPTTAAPGALLSYTKPAKVFGGNKIKLTVWNHKTAFEDIFNKYFKQYTDMHPNVEFEQTLVPFADMLKKLQVGIPAKQAPDIFYMFWLWHPPLVDTGLLRPMPEDRFPQKTLEATFNSMRATYRGSDGKAYWMPLGFLNGGLHINKKIWAKAGLTEKDVPTTWDKVIEIAKQLTVRDTAGRVQVAGYNPTGYVQATWRYHWYQQGLWSVSEDYKKVYMDVPEMKKTLGWFNDIYNVHKLSSPDFLRFDESFGTDKAAMIFMWTNALPNIRKYPDLDFASYRAPTWTGKMEPAVGHGTLDPQSLVVPVSTPDDRAEVCWDVIQFLYSNKDFLVEQALNQASPPLSNLIVDDPRIKADPIISTFLPQVPYIVQTMGLPQAVSDTYNKYVWEAPFTAGMPIDQALKEGQAQLDQAMNTGGPYFIKEREYKYANLMKFPGK